LHSQIDGAISSAGSEHLPYKQGVTGSNPVSPTKKSGDENLPDFFMPFFLSLNLLIRKAIHEGFFINRKLLTTDKGFCIFLSENKTVHQDASAHSSSTEIFSKICGRTKQFTERGKHPLYLDAKGPD
jgi:hypothetical protein